MSQLFVNRGYCRLKSRCVYIHPQTICQIFLQDGKCFVRGCLSRHPKDCKYQEQGCFRGNLCAYFHYDQVKDTDINHMKQRTPIKNVINVN